MFMFNLIMKKIKALITGSEGFVGPHLRKELEDNGYEVLRTSLRGRNDSIKCDITNKKQVEELIDSTKPDLIFHLAGFSSPSKSFKQPEICFKINVDGTKNLLESVAKLSNCKVLIVSSAEVYGNPKYLPIDENHPLNPLSPYAESRVEQEKITLKYPNTIIARSFNHTGPGQSTDFVIPSFKKQINDAKEGDTIYVGNLDILKDFSHVRDVVRAYRLLMEKGTLGEIYNVGSGGGYNIGSILKELIKKSGKNLEIKKTPLKFNNFEIKKSICDNTKIKKLGASFKKIF